MLVSVAVPLPFFKPLTYAVPDALVGRVGVGSRVVVPVRGRKEMGFVVGDASLRDGVTPKPLLGAPDDQPVHKWTEPEKIQLSADFVGVHEIKHTYYMVSGMGRARDLEPARTLPLPWRRTLGRDL